MSAGAVFGFVGTEPVFFTPYLAVLPYTNAGGFVGASDSGADSEPWPAPSPEESTARWISPAEQAGASGGEGAGPDGPSGEPDCVLYPNSCAYCTWEVKGPLPPCFVPTPEDPADIDDYVCATVSPPISNLQNAIDLAIANTQSNTIIYVNPGLYVGSLDIDLTGIQRHVIVASVEGPENTTIDATTAPGYAVHIYNAGPLGSRFTFGWHQANEVDERSPFDPLVPGQAELRGWQGFQIIGGKPESPNLYGAQVVVEDTIFPIAQPPFLAMTLVELRGNWIHSNLLPGPLDGAGVALVRNGDVDIVSNDISFCQAGLLGAGIGVFWDADERTEGKVTIAKNYVHDNTLDSGAVLLMTRGGGIYAGYQDVDICTNFIYRNRGDQGAGVYLDFTEDIGSQFLYVEANDIYLNGPLRVVQGISAWGAGIAVASSFSVPAQDRWQFGLVRNRIYQNGESSLESTYVERGGGVGIDMAFLDGLGPFGSFSEPPAGQIIVGNAIYLNRASVEGAGTYFAATAEIPGILWATNTIWENEIVGWSAPSGVGLYCPRVTSVPLPTSGRSSIVHFNIEGGLEDDWYVGDSPDNLFEVLTYTFTPICPDSPKDIFDPTVPTTDSETEPLLEGNPSFFRRYCRQFVNSPSVDAGQGVNETLTDFANPRLAVDFEGEPRIITLLDAGADEYNPDVLFIRFDANDDGVIDISDPIFILASLFIAGSPQPTCLDTADVNDDGNLNIVDPIFGLAYQYNGGPPPPAPFPVCGPDPTPDSISCLHYNHCP